MANSKNLHLIISSIVITIISLAYGIAPNSILSNFFDFKVETIDLHQVFRATMGLYLGMVLFWLLGIMKPSHWRMSTISNVLFMIGLALGRIISIIEDGIPSIYFLVGLVLEFILAFWGIRNLNKYRASL